MNEQEKRQLTGEDEVASEKMGEAEVVDAGRVVDDEMAMGEGDGPVSTESLEETHQEEVREDKEEPHGEQKEQPETEPEEGDTEKSEAEPEKKGIEKPQEITTQSVPKKAKKPLKKSVKIAIIIGVVLLLVGAGVLIWLLARPNNEAQEEAETAGVPKQELVEQHLAGNGLAKERVSLDVDSVAVTELYGRFPLNNLGTPFGVGEHFYEGNWTEKQMLDMVLIKALYNGIKDECKIQFGDHTQDEMLTKLKNRYEKIVKQGSYWNYYTRLDDRAKFDFLWNWHRDDVSRRGCLSGATVKKISKWLFGKEIDVSKIADGEGRLSSWGFYAPEYDEIYDRQFRYGSSGAYYTQRLIKAEKDANHIYLYEAVGVIDNQTLYKVSDRSKPVTSDGASDWSAWTVVQRNPELLDTYKWVFTKTNDGGYALSKVERM